MKNKKRERLALSLFLQNVPCGLDFLEVQAYDESNTLMR